MEKNLKKTETTIPVEPRPYRNFLRVHLLCHSPLSYFSSLSPNPPLPSFFLFPPPVNHTRTAFANFFPEGASLHRSRS